MKNSVLNYLAVELSIKTVGISSVGSEDSQTVINFPFASPNILSQFNA